MFACRVIDDGQGQYGELQRATWRQGYWMRDINQVGAEIYPGPKASRLDVCYCEGIMFLRFGGCSGSPGCH